MKHSNVNNISHREASLHLPLFIPRNKSLNKNKDRSAEAQVCICVSNLRISQVDNAETAGFDRLAISA